MIGGTSLVLPGLCRNDVLTFGLFAIHHINKHKEEHA